MKKLSLLLLLFLMGCAYHNPLEKAGFRFQTLVVSPYVLSTWYRISEQGSPLVVYVEDFEISPAEMVRQQAILGAPVSIFTRPFVKKK